MKLTHEDITKFATEDERKQLTEGWVDVKKRKIGRPTNMTQLKKLKDRKSEALNYLKIEISNMDDYCQWENWDDLEMEIHDAAVDLKTIISLNDKIKDLSIKLKLVPKEDEEDLEV